MAVVFISFADEERRIAIALKRVLEANIVDCKPFATADHWQMNAGERWLDRIASELRTTKIMIVIMSSRSVARPWINFEAGAAWLNGARVIPACIGSLSPKNLPKPYNDFQAVRLVDDNELYQLIRSVSEAEGHVIPPLPPFPSEPELTELRDAIAELVDPPVPPSIPAAPLELSRDAEQILTEAARSATGQILRYDLDQALVLQVNGQSLSADISQGRRRAELAEALAELENHALIEDVGGKRRVFAVTGRGYSHVEKSHV